MGIFVSALLKVYLYQGNNLFAKYFSSQFTRVKDLPVCGVDFLSDNVFEAI